MQLGATSCDDAMDESASAATSIVVVGDIINSRNEIMNGFDD
jgi:hypothetical protein